MMTGKKIRRWPIPLLLVLASACMGERDEFPEEMWDTSLTFNMARVPEAILSNTEVYLFDGEGASRNQFNHKAVQVVYGLSQLTMPVAAGRWNVALVSADRDISSELISPARGGERHSLKMWETKSSGGFLQGMPELRTAFMTDQHVLARQQNAVTQTVQLARNVALVKVVVVSASGLDLGGTHRFELTNVPTTLNWNGGLYPNKNNPTVSAAPMRGEFTLRNSTTQQDSQQSDTLQFMIPAHRGTNEATDTTTSKLRFSVRLTTEGGGEYEKRDIVIPRAPRANGVLLVRLTLGVGVKVGLSTRLLNWVSQSADGDVPTRKLNLSATRKYLYKRRRVEYIYFNSNQRRVRLESMAYNSSGEPIAINTILQSPRVAPNYRYTYDGVSELGSGYMALLPTSSAPSGRYKIYLNAGGLRREITIWVV